MTVISQQHFIESVADALQYISYYHPMDYIESMTIAVREAVAAQFVQGQPKLLNQVSGR